MQKRREVTLMRIGSGLSQVGNILITPRYPESPIQRVEKTMPVESGSAFKLGTFSSLKALSSVGGKNITLTMPDGRVIVGHFIDIFA